MTVREFVAAIGALMRWLGTPIRAAAGWFPFTREGRRTLIYLAFAFAGPALTLFVLWIMAEALQRPRLQSTFERLALIVAVALLIAVIGLAVYVALRAVKLNRDGLEVSGEGGDDE